MLTDYRKFQYALGEQFRHAPLPAPESETRTIVMKRHAAQHPGHLGSAYVMIRDDDGFEVHLIQNIVYHSPDGFEWGYHGSGPADLALNILDLILPSKEANRLHQLFKGQFVAQVPQEGGEIKLSDVIRWIAQHYADESEAIMEHQAAANS